MKADIPDKILINRDEDGKIHHSYWTTDKQLIPFEDVEYVRKDALLEWANSWLAFKRSGLVLDDGFSYAMEELIKKLNEM